MAAAAEWIGLVGAMRAPAVRAGGSGSAGGADLQRRLAGLARSRGPLRRALAAVAVRMVATLGWQRLGFARLSDYARELQDMARVDRALRELPQLETALVAGSLPWTKARLLARAARAEDEAAWLAFAKRVSAGELAQAVRAVDAGSVDVAERRLYRLRGYPGLDDYASERLGLSPRKARALLRVERAARTCPALCLTAAARSMCLTPHRI